MWIRGFSASPPPPLKITKKGWEGVTFPALSLSSIPVFTPEEYV